MYAILKLIKIKSEWLLIWDKVDFRAKNIRDKVNKDRSIQQEDIIILNVYTPKVSKYIN